MALTLTSAPGLELFIDRTEPLRLASFCFALVLVYREGAGQESVRIAKLRFDCGYMHSPSP